MINYKTMLGGWYDHFVKHKLIEYTEEVINELDQLYLLANVYPEKKQVFRVFKESTPDDIKVVLLGQDPYHNLYKNVPSACGRAFATENGYLNPSLKNLLIEYKNNIGVEQKDLSLQNWVDEGVLLLNTALTVEEGLPGSHMYLWNRFMATLIPTIENKTWILLGVKAQSWEKYINGTVIRAAHPSPLAGGKFFGSNIFSQTKHLIKWH